MSDELNKMKKVLKKIVSQEYDLGENYEMELRRKIKRMMDLKELRKVTQTWSLKDLEMADDMLRHRKDYSPEEFAKQFAQKITPLLGRWWKYQDVEEVCVVLSFVVAERICEESPKYKLWV